MLGAIVTVALMTTGACGGTPPGNGDQPTTTPSAPPTNPDMVTVTGTVMAGIEPGCLVLDTAEDQYLLINGDRPLLEPGRRVVVSGIPRPGTPTTCMQGIPLDVRDVQPAI